MDGEGGGGERDGVGQEREQRMNRGKGNEREEWRRIEGGRKEEREGEELKIEGRGRSGRAGSEGGERTDEREKERWIVREVPLNSSPSFPFSLFLSVLLSLDVPSFLPLPPHPAIPLSAIPLSAISHIPFLYSPSLPFCA